MDSCTLMQVVSFPLQLPNSRNFSRTAMDLGLKLLEEKAVNRFTLFDLQKSLMTS